jgi:hypothetical protein
MRNIAVNSEPYPLHADTESIAANDMQRDFLEGTPSLLAVTKGRGCGAFTAVYWAFGHC